MARVTSIPGMRPEGSGTLDVELLWESDLPDGQSVVKHLHIDRDEFLDWDKFQLAIERAGIRPGVVWTLRGSKSRWP